jgi:hypothetical protein
MVLFAILVGFLLITLFAFGDAAGECVCMSVCVYICMCVSYVISVCMCGIWYICMCASYFLPSVTQQVCMYVVIFPVPLLIPLTSTSVTSHLCYPATYIYLHLTPPLSPLSPLPL